MSRRATLPEQRAVVRQREERQTEKGHVHTETREKNCRPAAKPFLLQEL